MASEEDSASELSSDEEVCDLISMIDVVCNVTHPLSLSAQLQVGLAQGTLKPGLIGKVAPPRTFTNNVVRLLIITGSPFKVTITLFHSTRVLSVGMISLLYIYIATHVCTYTCSQVFERSYLH